MINIMIEPSRKKAPLLVCLSYLLPRIQDNNQTIFLVTTSTLGQKADPKRERGFGLDKLLRVV